MTIKTKTFVRTPFEVEAVQVSEINVMEVAAWCKGLIHPGNPQVENGLQGHIQVPVHGYSVSERQKRAFVGDWVLKSEKGFRIYTDKAFKGCFEAKTTLLDADGERVPFATSA